MTSEQSPRTNGMRLTALRDLFNLTQTGLSERLEVNQSFLSRIEKGERPLPDDLMVRACFAYRLPQSFFEVSVSDADLLVQTFWKNSKATARDEARIKRLHREATRLFQMASERSGFHPAKLPNPDDHGGNVEHVASVTRILMGLQPGTALLNSTRALERLGIGVVSNLDHIDLERADHKGISMPHARTGRPLIALIGELNGSEQRFAALHELGHLLFDQGLTVPIRTRRDPKEERAHRFARAVLLPLEVMPDLISESLNLSGYLKIKAQFGASVATIIKRGQDLSLISEPRARSLFIQWSTQGWRHNEPVEVATEKPTLLRQAILHVYGGSGVVLAAKDSGVPEDLIRQWTGIESNTIMTNTSVGSASVIDLNAHRLNRSTSAVAMSNPSAD